MTPMYSYWEIRKQYKLNQCWREEHWRLWIHSLKKASGEYFAVPSFSKFWWERKSHTDNYIGLVVIRQKNTTRRYNFGRLINDSLRSFINKIRSHTTSCYLFFVITIILTHWPSVRCEIEGDGETLLAGIDVVLNRSLHLQYFRDTITFSQSLLVKHKFNCNSAFTIHLGRFTTVLIVNYSIPKSTVPFRTCLATHHKLPL